MTAATQERTTPALQVGQTRPAHRPDIQGLRAIAVILVVLYHADFSFSGGFIGVDVFFVLSGFVITRGLLFETETTGTIDLGRFFKRRISRILPAATATTAAVLVALPLLGPLVHRNQAVKTGLAGVLFNANTFLTFGSDEPGGSLANYFNPATELNPFLHMWSLSVEEQFYFFFPALVFIVGRLSRRSSRDVRPLLLKTFLAVMAGSFVASLIVIEQSALWAFYLSPFRAWEFLVGAVLVWIERRHRRQSVSNGIFLAGALILVVAALAFNETQQFPGWRAAVPVAAAAMLITGGREANNTLSTVVNNPITGFVGRVSYAWYLWHWPLLVFTRATFPHSTMAIVIAVVGSFALAAASTLLLEEPLRNNVKVQSRTAATIMTCVVISLGAFFAGEGISTAVGGTETASFLDETFRPYAAQTSGCQSISSSPQGCHVTGTEGAQDVVLLGDSTALQLFDGLRTTAESDGFSLRLATQSFCASNQFESTVFGERYLACDQFWNEVVEEIRADPPDTVVLAISLNDYIHSSNVQLRTAGGDWVSNSAERRQIVEDGLTATFADLASLSNVVYVGTTPNFGGWAPLECSFATWQLRPTTCAPEAARWAEIEESRREASSIEDRIRSLDGVEFVDLDASLCSGTTCGPFSDGRWIFRDPSHITADQSIAVAPVVTEAILQ